MDFLANFPLIKVKYYMKSIFYPDIIENDHTDSSENGSQDTYPINPPAWSDFAILPFLSEPIGFTGLNSEPKHPQEAFLHELMLWDG